MAIELSSANAAVYLPSANANAASSSAASAVQNDSIIGGLTDNLDVFLKILTTQLTNQNPLDPLDTDKFTSQLTEFASVEQTMGTNTRLDELTTLIGGQKVDSAIAYVGKDVSFASASGWNAGEGIDWDVTLPESSQAVSVRVLNDEGTPVYSTNAAFDVGSKRISWDGTNNGVSLPEGKYTLEINAQTRDGDPLYAAIRANGRVIAADLGGLVPSMVIGQLRVPVSDVAVVSIPDSSGSASSEVTEGSDTAED